MVVVSEQRDNNFGNSEQCVINSISCYTFHSDPGIHLHTSDVITQSESHLFDISDLREDCAGFGKICNAFVSSLRSLLSDALRFNQLILARTVMKAKNGNGINFDDDNRIYRRPLSVMRLTDTPK